MTSGMHRSMMAVTLLAGLAGCAKGSAENAVESAERAVANIQEQAVLIAPTQLTALQDSLEAVKGRLAAGEYQSVLMSARSLTSQARDLGAQLETQKAQVTSAFNSATTEVPPMLDAVRARVEELGRLRRLPAGIDTAAFRALQQDVGTWAAQWTSATEVFAKGELANALSTATQLRTKARNARALLKME